MGIVQQSKWRNARKYLVSCKTLPVWYHSDGSNLFSDSSFIAPSCYLCCSTFIYSRFRINTLLHQYLQNEDVFLSKKPCLWHQRNAPPKCRPVTHLKSSGMGSKEWEMGGKKKQKVRQTSCSKGSFSLRARYLTAEAACKAGSAHFPPAAGEGHRLSSARHHGNASVRLWQTSKEMCSKHARSLDKSKSTGTIPGVHATTE